jgi:hypothetical protein
MNIWNFPRCWEESDRLFIEITLSVGVMSHEEVSWPLTLRQEIPNIHILTEFLAISTNLRIFFFYSRA